MSSSRTSSCTLAFLQDLAVGSDRTNPVMDIVRPVLGYVVTKSAVMARYKPMNRCENCKKSPEDIGDDVKLMICSVCNVKSKFIVNCCFHACQKEDWREHKKICGIQKATKTLHGTARDPTWRIPDCPEFVHGMLSVANPGLPINEIGFGILHSSRTLSAALQIQLTVLDRDESVDYFIFDEKYCLFPLVIDDMGLKLSFRIMRSDAIFSKDQLGLPALLEFLVKETQEIPEMNHNMVLKQLSVEYEVDVKAKVEESVKVGARRMKDYPKIKSHLGVMASLVGKSWSRMSKMVD